MKKLLALVLSAMLLLGAMPAALAEITPEDYYTIARATVETITGKAPVSSSTDPDFNGIMAIMVMDGSGGGDPQFAVIGPRGQYTLWRLPGKSSAEMLLIFVQALETWQHFSYNISGYPFGILFSSDEHGSMTVRSQADAQTVISAIRDVSPAPTTRPTATARPTAVPVSRPIVPSILSFADYRISVEDYTAQDNYYSVRGGLSTSAIRTALADDYVRLLTTKYPFRLVDTIDNGSSVYYLLDYTGAGNIRPVVANRYSADVIVKRDSDSFDQYNFCFLFVYVSPSLDFVETDDRTTVNLR